VANPKQFFFVLAHVRLHGDSYSAPKVTYMKMFYARK
jgi:hypothetical protein